MPFLLRRTSATLRRREIKLLRRLKYFERPTAIITCHRIPNRHLEVLSKNLKNDKADLRNGFQLQKYALTILETIRRKYLSGSYS